MGKYFQKDRILPIPELLQAVEPKTLSFVLTDTRTKKLAGLKKRDLHGAPKNRWHLVSILLQTMFSYMGHPAALGGSSLKAGCEDNNGQILPASARVQEPQKN